eukprot:CAMPEP_0169347226 /NCGR_PEP_ID=MMETSP1017-20121227/22528_1 /TAXON_ID=342587 /ORGANISM="Karlodinium micrum, Strain CCMP2283" /LENGTH=60 /DNA_ID=CAMNT_0009443197 /DNA_START=177 /DNA_END=356 /DNA_ORIENTATION=+
MSGKLQVLRVCPSIRSTFPPWALIEFKSQSELAGARLEPKPTEPPTWATGEDARWLWTGT